ncbi:hypothetical protein [Candidatus Nitrotoga sp. AM1P]|uniref:hypothetical protein n=1 Tax=Candidatus Nitrotoga sp. AM1P TaxID=2559597 RepID=UPI0010B65801|nr:hypothetical protein [Candidatus Nitrotoga sp. AM1P]BBJ23048.1 hypothetical protein W01_09750 [Candidatus Nitrotoga sp. AM1P]
MGPDQDNDKIKGASGTDAPIADRSDLRWVHGKRVAPSDDEADKDFEQDISRMANGFRQISKDAISAMRQIVSTNPHSEQNRQRNADSQKQREKDRRELENLAAWSAKIVTVGGVQMTNGEAQKARQGVIDNADHYARWVVEQGRIRPDEKEEFKEGLKCNKELEDKRGRGTITASEEQELIKWERSRLGQAGNIATGQYHKDKGALPVLNSGQAATDSELKSKAVSASPLDEKLFQSAPNLGADFVAAQAAQTPLDEKKQSPVPIAVSPDIKGTGLSI